jgi:hypothetical protein
MRVWQDQLELIYFNATSCYIMHAREMFFIDSISFSRRSIIVFLFYAGVLH